MDVSRLLTLRGLGLVGVLTPVLTFASPAHAWFFFFVPLGLFTSKGDTCVSKEAKVGDPISKPDGTSVQVKVLNGTSIKCSDARYPILAEVEASTSKLPDNVSSARMDIPEGWVQQTVPEGMKAASVVMYALNNTIDAGLQFLAYPRSTITNLSDFVSTRKAAQMSRLRDAEPYPTQQLTIDGFPALRYEVRGRVPSGVEYKYVSTFVEGPNEIVGVIAWTYAASFEQTKPKLVAIADSITGLAPRASQTQATAPAAEQPVLQKASVSQESAAALPESPAVIKGPGTAQKSNQAAQRLRELNNLFKEGVITQEEFDQKKKPLLDAL